MTTTICKTFTFDAAHKLPNHHGKCAHLHGHTYRVELILTGEISREDGASDEGMLIDFGDVKAAWQSLHDLMDHKYLNDELPMAYHPTTAENIAQFILDSLSDTFASAELFAVRVWETPTSWAQAADG